MTASTNYLYSIILQLNYGGGRGIRTPGTLPGTVVFKTTAIDHSAIPPRLDSSRKSERSFVGAAEPSSGLQPSVISIARRPTALPVGEAAAGFVSQVLATRLLAGWHGWREAQTPGANVSFVVTDETWIR